MFTSFIQYLLLLPSYVNILQIYAFCNLHDVSWGTKGDNGAAKDLGQVKIVKKNGEKLAEVKATRQEDIEDLYRQARAELRAPIEHVKEKRSEETKRNDADRNFRTHVVLWFLGVNMVLILVLTSNKVTEWLNTKFNSNSGETIFNPYLVSGAQAQLERETVTIADVPTEVHLLGRACAVRDALLGLHHLSHFLVPWPVVVR